MRNVDAFIDNANDYVPAALRNVPGLRRSDKIQTVELIRIEVIRNKLRPLALGVLRCRERKRTTCPRVRRQQNGRSQHPEQQKSEYRRLRNASPSHPGLRLKLRICHFGKALDAPNGRALS